VKSRAHYIKTAILTALLFLQTLTLTNILLTHVKTHDLITPSPNVIVKVAIVMLCIAYTQAFTVGAWDNWTQFLILPIPIALGVFTVIAPINYIHALVVTTLVALIMIYNTLKATRLQSILIRIKPSIFLRATTKGIFLSVALAATSLVLANPTKGEPLNIGKELGELAKNHIKEIVVKSTEIPTEIPADILEVDFKTEIANQINTALEPYQNFVVPIMAGLTFALIEGLSMGVYIIFAITVEPIFWLAKRLRFFEVRYENVNQEKVGF